MKPARRNQQRLPKSRDLGVGPSRAGDAFHYRWAARRCLLMINPQSPLRAITVEASKERAAGESVIDLAEYVQPPKRRQSVDYQQLKHSTVRVNQPLKLPELRRTLVNFGARYSECLSRKLGYRLGEVTFAIVTNRPIDPELVRAVGALARGLVPTAGVGVQFAALFSFKSPLLRAFCQALRFVDRQGDYRDQSRKLKDEIQGFVAEQVEDTTVNHVVALVQERVMPHQAKGRAKGEIRREDVLQRLGATSDRDLFPARPQFESVRNLVPREQHAELETAISTSSAPMVIHAPGGVGKSVVVQQLVESFSRDGILAVAYDCFGGGNYRNQAEPRHRPCDALVQVANELAARGLCQVLLARPSSPPDFVLRSFLARLEAAVRNLRKTKPRAKLVVLFDAADNAEMAAEEFGERCFANAVMRLNLPRHCHLVALCRTERVHMLKPKDETRQVALRPFSEAETAAHLRRTFPEASDNQVLQFHRLTSGNPRVQANALSEAKSGLGAVLAALGPGGTTVEAQIREQLQRAIRRVKSPHGDDFASKVEAVCTGLASLPPNIPLAILATAAGVDAATIKSFVSDLGRPLWLSDSTVHFKDEPTETWFRDTFGADPDRIKRYVTALEPLAATSTYVAQALPKLLHRAGENDRLLQLALTDEFLPTGSPVEARDIRVYRLQYAFKAALKLKRLRDAVQLAFRAGEEAAGDERQLRILADNLDLAAELHEPHRVQELAMRQSLHAAWDGSENLFSASLLCRFKEFRGDASAFLDSARTWLRLFFEARDKQEQHSQFGEQLHDEHCAEFAWVRYHLDGPAAGVESLLRWQPPEFVYRITRIFVRRMIDLGRIAEIDRIARLGARSPHFTLAVTEQLMTVGLAPPKEALLATCRVLSAKNPPIARTKQYQDRHSMTLAAIIFAEACALRKLPKKKILRILSFYSSAKADYSVGSDYRSEERTIFVRALALRLALERRPLPEVATLLPKPRKKESAHDRDQEVRRITDALDALLPWQHLRARLLVGDRTALAFDPTSIRSREARDDYGRINHAAFEATLVQFEALALRPDLPKAWADHFTKNIAQRPEWRFTLNDRLRALRTACRRRHLASLRGGLEESCRGVIEQPSTEGPEEKSSHYLSLARAVLPVSHADALAYFGEAIDIASKFGDEMVDRWRALSAVAQQSAGSSPAPSLSYRYIKVAEAVGESVAREKYWEREDVFRVMVHLDAPSAAAGLSRWRDRRVGWFDGEVRAFASEALAEKKITPAVAWSLTGFKGLNGSAAHAISCLRAEGSPAVRSVMLRQAIRDMRLTGASKENWELLRQAVRELGLDDAEIRTELAVHGLISVRKTPPEDARRARYRPTSTWPAGMWRGFFKNADFNSVSGMTATMDRFFAAEPPKDQMEFWKCFYDRLPRGREQDALEALLACEHADFFDIVNPLQHARAHWMGYKAVSRAWEDYLRRLGNRHALAVCSYQRMIYLSEQYGFTEQDLRCLKDGAVDGLRDSPELVTAGTFFGFALHAAQRLAPVEAQQVLDFALGRFEQHIDPASADGPWQEALKPPDSMPQSAAAIVWCALASPYSATRWQAAHVVRRLVACGCVEEIAALVGYYDTDGAQAFRAAKFPFYLLHARLYLLVGFARAAHEAPHALRPHGNFLAKVASGGTPHILLQHFAREAALSLERAFPGTYPPETMAKLAAVNRSPFPIQPRTQKGKDATTPWHDSDELTKAPKIHFGIDFDEYWFEPLGRVFGVSRNDVRSLTANAVVQELGAPADDEFHPDPRSPQYERMDYSSRGTYHSHSSYPKNDEQHFYQAYHGMMMAAARLLQAMPVRHPEYSSDDRTDPWDDWLDRHLSIRRDGNWVSDRRDPEPLVRRPWVGGRDSDDWEWQVAATDFFEVMRDSTFMNGGLCVYADWEEHGSEYREREEEFMIRSALVSPGNSEALARAMREARDPREFHLPDYQEKENEVEAGPFELKGWIVRDTTRDDRMDALDPYAKRMYYPAFRLGASIEEALALTADAERREWRNAAGEVVVRSRIWAKILRRTDEESPMTGRQVFASVPFLREMCRRLNKHLIIQVRIKRDRRRDYRSEPYRERVDVPPSMKIFLLTPHGNLREDRRSHRIG